MINKGVAIVLIAVDYLVAVAFKIINWIEGISWLSPTYMLSRRAHDFA